MRILTIAIVLFAGCSSTKISNNKITTKTTKPEGYKVVMETEQTQIEQAYLKAFDRGYNKFLEQTGQLPNWKYTTLTEDDEQKFELSNPKIKQVYDRGYADGYHAAGKKSTMGSCTYIGSMSPKD